VVIWSWRRPGGSFHHGQRDALGAGADYRLLVGIGRAAAISLHAAGLSVYTTARQVDALADLARQGIHTLALDVTDEA